MTDKLTTAEVRLAATTNLDLPLTQYKKLESGFDAWLERVKAEARTEGANVALAAANIRAPRSVTVKDPSTVPSPDIAKADDDSTAPRVRDPKRKRIRPKKNKQVPAVENPAT